MPTLTDTRNQSPDTVLDWLLPWTSDFGPKGQVKFRGTKAQAAVRRSNLNAKFPARHYELQEADNAARS